MTEPTTKKKTGVRKFVAKAPFKDNPLPVLYSARIRLTDEERQQFKQAYLKRAESEMPTANASIGNSSIKSVTAYGNAPAIDHALGMNRTVFMDIVSSRDTVALTILLKLQSVLDIEVITAEKLQTAFEHYLHYVMTMYLEE